MADLSDAHHCSWQEEAERLRAELDKAEGLRTELDDVRGKLAAVTAAMEGAHAPGARSQVGEGAAS